MKLGKLLEIEIKDSYVEVRFLLDDGYLHESQLNNIYIVRKISHSKFKEMLNSLKTDIESLENKLG